MANLSCNPEKRGLSNHEWELSGHGAMAICGPGMIAAGVAQPRGRSDREALRLRGKRIGQVKIASTNAQPAKRIQIWILLRICPKRRFMSWGVSWGRM